MRPHLWIAAALLPLLFARSGSAGQKSENVILVTIDGLRWQEVFSGAEEALFDPKDEAPRREFWRETAEERRDALMPFLWEVISARGQLWGNRAKGSSVQLTNGHKFSFPGYQELLAGYPDPKIHSNEKIPNPNVTVLEWLSRRPGFEGRVAAFGSWDRLPYILNRGRSGLTVNTFDEDIRDEPLSERQIAINELRKVTPAPWPESHFDGFTHYAALEHLRRHKPRVLYILYEEPDEWAHGGLYREYLRSTRRIDGFLRQLWGILQSMPEYKDKTTVIVTADHGRGNGPQWKDHYADIAGAEDIWIAAMGPSVAPLGERVSSGRATQGQVAATVAAALGEDYARAEPKAAAPLDLER